MRKRMVQSQNQIKVNNLKLVLHLIRENQGGQISRADIAKMTRMSATSITRITEDLMEMGLIRQAGIVGNTGVGRKGIDLQVVDNAVLTIGISIDSDCISVCILNFENQIIARADTVLEKRPYTPDEVLAIAYESSQGLCRETGYAEDQIRAVGISCIGNINYRTGRIYFAPQFQWTNVDLGEMAGNLFRQPVFVDNDMKSSLIGLANRRPNLMAEDVTYLSIGTGVGAAVMYGGTIVRGNNNAAGEVGHIILESDGRLCDCGQTGCVQTYLTKNSLIEQCRERGREIPDVEALFMACRQQQEWALQFTGELARHLAVLLRNLVYMYDTRYILVGGDMMCRFPELYKMARIRLKEFLHENHYANLHLELVAEQDNSMAGASFMAQELYIESCLFA